MKTVLVTGAAGFIGSNVSRALLARGYRVVGVDNFDETYDTRFKEENIADLVSDKNFLLERLDICEKAALLALTEKEKPNFIIHLAAKADTRNAVEAPEIYTAVNIDGTLNILEAAKTAKVERLVMASSSSVYGNDANVPWQENATADRPISPYGATKRATELLAYTYHHNFGLSIACLRYFNAYGEGNRPNMVPYKWAQALLKGEEIEMSGGGTRKRDYTYIGDIVDGTIASMTAPLAFEVINLGNNSPVSLNDLLATFEKVIGTKAKVKSRPSHAASVETTYADIGKAYKLLGWKPKTSLEEGVTKLVAWFRANRLEDTK